MADTDTPSPAAVKTTGVTSGAIMVALIGVLAALVANVAKGIFDLRLERERFTKDIVIQAIASPREDDARLRLKFFVRVGLLDSARFAAVLVDTLDPIPTGLDRLPINRFLALAPDSVRSVLSRVQSFADFRERTATLDEAERILSSSGVHQVRRGVDWVTGVMPRGWTVTIWPGSYGNPKAYGIRYGPTAGEQETYFELLIP